MTEGCDYAWGRPGPAALTNAGKHFACRYLSPGANGKNLDHAEAKGLSDAGIWIVLVWESTANRALDGHAAGAQDARDAQAQALACGMPAGRPIYFAVDFDASANVGAILSYFAGAASVLTAARTGVYGGVAAVRATFNAGVVHWGWQTYAWSGGQWDSRAQLQQYSNGHRIGGVDCDLDRAVHTDFGQWRVGQTPTPPPPQPAQEDDMPYGMLKDGPHAVTTISLPKGKYKSVGFLADNGLQGLVPAALRVAVFHGAAGTPAVQIATATVDSKTGQAVVTFTDPATTTGLSVRREDAGDVVVGYEVS